MQHCAKKGQAHTGPPWYHDYFNGSAGAASACAATIAAAAAAQRLCGADGETFLPTVVNEINLYVSTHIRQFLVDEVGQAVEFVGVVVILWFIQNQAQRRAASAARLEINPQSGIEITLRQEFLDRLIGVGSHFDHVASPFFRRPAGSRGVLYKSLLKK